MSGPSKISIITDAIKMHAGASDSDAYHIAKRVMKASRIRSIPNLRRMRMNEALAGTPICAWFAHTPDGRIINRIIELRYGASVIIRL